MISNSTSLRDSDDAFRWWCIGGIGLIYCCVCCLCNQERVEDVYEWAQFQYRRLMTAEPETSNGYILC